MLLVETTHVAQPQLVAAFTFPLIEVRGKDGRLHRMAGCGAQVRRGHLPEDVRRHRSVGVEVVP